MGSRTRRAPTLRVGTLVAILIVIGVAAYPCAKVVSWIIRPTDRASVSAANAVHAPHTPTARPGPTKALTPRHPRKKGSGTARHSPAPSSAPSPPSLRPSAPPATSLAAGNVNCDYRQDTWSGDASSVGYSVRRVQSVDGRLSSYAVVLNAQRGTTEVVGYPSEQCLLYSPLPPALTARFEISPPPRSAGLDYEYAFDIWLTTAAAARADNWNNDLELMIWTYVKGQVPAGSVTGELSDGSKIWRDGNNTTGIVSVVLPRSETLGTVDITSIVDQLRAVGDVTSADTGILDVEYGIEAPYGGGQTFRVRGFSVTSR